MGEANGGVTGGGGCLSLSTDWKPKNGPLPHPSQGSSVRVGSLETTDTGKSSEFGTGVAEEGRYHG